MAAALEVFNTLRLLMIIKIFNEQSDYKSDFKNLEIKELENWPKDKKEEFNSLAKVIFPWTGTKVGDYSKTDTDDFIRGKKSLTREVMYAMHNK